MSAVKKYTAMENAVCADGRLRGMFRFYGANRSGRFSGTIVQLQNLFRNSLPDLIQARSLVSRGDYDALETLYESVPEVLAQCVRTAFIPAPGYKMIVADFSAIECRVLAWLAGEQWVLDVFAAGGDIYCETAGCSIARWRSTAKMANSVKKESRPPSAVVMAEPKAL